MSKAVQNANPVKVITARKIIWWNPLSWFLKRFRKEVFHYKPVKFYEQIMKESYIAARKG